MNRTSGQSTSIWTQTVEVPSEPVLAESTQADVCVIGAGIAGLTTAYLLTRQQKSVVVLDNKPVGGGQTGRTTAHIASALDDRYFEVEQLRGKEEAQLVAQSLIASIDQIEAIVTEEKIDCDFERLDGYLFNVPGEPEDILEQELAAAHRAGLTDVEQVRLPLDSFDPGPCLRFPRQAQFDPLKYLAGLVQAIEGAGGHIFTETHVTKIEGGSPARVETKTGLTVTADAVVVATNIPVNDRSGLFAKQASYQTYVIGARVPKGSIPKALYWDTLDPYHYVRLANVATPDKVGETDDLLIVGGEDHKTGQADDAMLRYTRLETWTRERFPMAKQIEFRWSGQVMEPIDGLPFIGRNPLDGANVYIATGDSGTGMTNGTIAGILISDLILGRDNPWQTLYDPARVTLGAATDFVQENLNVATQYLDWIKGGEDLSLAAIAPGTGVVVRRGLKKVAVYCDEQGALHERSAVCPHLHCIVAWNSGEKTWDCPCHGSRFDNQGQVINGPTTNDLASAE